MKSTAQELSDEHAAGISLLRIIGEVNERTALYVINWVLGFNFTEALSVHLPSARLVKKFQQPHLMPKLRNQLKELNCRAEEANLADICALTSLSELALDQLQVGDTAPFAAWRLPELRVIRFSECKGLLAALLRAGSLPKLKKFQADGCKFGIGLAGNFDFLLRFTSLQSLRLHDCDLHQLPSLAALTRLEIFEVTGSDRMQDLRPVLSGLQSLTELRTINVRPSDQFVTAIVSVPSVVTLTVNWERVRLQDLHHLSRLNAVMSNRNGVMNQV